MNSAVLIWMLLLLAGVAALLGLALPHDVRRPRQVTAWLADGARRRREQAEAQAAEALESIRYAEEIAVAARGAAHTAERRRADCQEAQERVEAAWQAQQDAEAALDRVRRATAYVSREQVDYPDRARALRRGAQAAYRRGDLSDTQLLDALTHRNGWDPELHPVDQELVLAKATVRHRTTAYRAAAEAESEAWRAADIATASVRTLRQELTEAAARADAARAKLPPKERATVPPLRVVPVHA